MTLKYSTHIPRSRRHRQRSGGVCLRPKEDGITMPDGRDVFIHACRYMIHALNNSLENSGLQREDISKFICHQANKRIVAQVAHQLDMGWIVSHNNRGTG